MKNFILIFTILTWVFTSCEEKHDGPSKNVASKYPGDVATKWIALQSKLIKKTAGFDPLVSSRSYAYSGLTLYEAVVKGMPGYNSVASQLIGENINALPDQQEIDWSASANAAMAFILKNLFANTAAANQATIDSLESALNSEYENKSTAQIVSASADYGRKVANSIFEWSKSDGGHEAYLGAINNSYIAPTGPGLWIPTPPALSPPIRPFWGDNRCFIPNSVVSTAPGPPIPYSESPDSEFYKAVNEVYTISVSRTEEDVRIVRHWGDIPGNYNTPSHYTHIATQLIEENDLKLDQAAVTYAKHGIAINEAIICVFKAKYIHNLIRPISYIRNVLGQPTWNTVISTPAHPEYPSAHATVGGASYTVLENIFGKNHAFVDRTHENLHGARTYENLKAYATEAARSRVLAGIHYQFSADVGLAQGEKVGDLVNKIKFK
ncbi:MAG TPA: vanadium-dependent haloperoxidase [Chryseolinea sp.]|nr:vanadium-dependent haloperoxidase [Chryseolinea sp.]